MGALAAGVAFAVAVTVVLESYREAFLAWFNQTIAASDLAVSRGLNQGLLSGPTIDPRLEGELASVKGVARVMPWRFLEVEYRGQPIMIQAASETLLQRIYPDWDPKDGVLISDVLSERFGLGAGDAIELPAPISPLTVRVAGVVPDYVLHLGCVKLGWEEFTRHFGRAGVTLFAVDVAKGADLREVKAGIESLGGDAYDLSVLTAVEMREVVEHLVDQSVALTYWLQLLGAIVAIAAMVNASAASIVDRVAELRLWRAFGLPRRHLVWLLTLEAAIVGALGSAVGLLAGVALGYPVATTITRAVAGFRLDIRWPVEAAMVLFLLSTLAAAGTAHLVARGWTRRDVPVEPART
jgi:putative ABC transport system permease protein